jgi:hypothetical protein
MRARTVRRSAPCCSSSRGPRLARASTAADLLVALTLHQNSAPHVSEYALADALSPIDFLQQTVEVCEKFAARVPLRLRLTIPPGAERLRQTVTNIVAAGRSDPIANVPGRTEPVTTHSNNGESGRLPDRVRIDQDDSLMRRKGTGETAGSFADRGLSALARLRRRIAVTAPRPGAPDGDVPRFASSGRTVFAVDFDGVIADTKSQKS